MYLWMNGRLTISTLFSFGATKVNHPEVSIQQIWHLVQQREATGLYHLHTEEVLPDI